jgi:hypothetical protein
MRNKTGLTNDIDIPPLPMQHKPYKRHALGKALAPAVDCQQAGTHLLKHCVFNLQHISQHIY